MTKIYLLRVRAEDSILEDIGEFTISLPGFIVEKTLFCTKSERTALRKFYEYSGKYYGKKIPWVSNRIGHDYYDVELYLEEHRFDEKNFTKEPDELTFYEDEETAAGYPSPAATIEGETWTVMPRGRKS